MATAALIPALLTPANLTKHIKVYLDSAGWRDKTRLIARYSHLQLNTRQEQQDPDRWIAAQGTDLSTYMIMALLPKGPFAPGSGHMDGATTLEDLFQAPKDLPASLSDPVVQRSLFLIWLDPAVFTSPRHLLVQTPLEKLKDTLTQFLSLHLQQWATDPLTAHPDQTLLSMDCLPDLINSIPQKWEHYSDFTLLPPTAFLVAPWPAVLGRWVAMDHKSIENGSQERIMDQMEKLVQEALQSTHIARKAIIPVQDILRRPKIRPLTGDWGIHNVFKSWIEQDDVGHLDHHEVPASTTTTLASIMAPDLETPTPDNFKAAYWAMTSQNQVWYSWAPMFTMFSAGNITEKERVAHSRPIFDAQDKVVVDLYAGIGYFTLVYLIHAGAKTVHACEWNPWSVEGLARGADRNGISWSNVTQPSTEPSVSDSTSRSVSKPSRGKKGTKEPPKPLGNLVIYPGDNAQWISHFENQAHHVNLGLIPSAEPGWVLGVRALCPKEGGYLHVHHNIRVGEEKAFQQHLLQTLQSQFREWKRQCSDCEGAGQESLWSVDIRHMENIKSFAPLVFHYVADVECRPPRSCSHESS